MSNSLIWSSSSYTHVGTVRSVNQDNHLEMQMSDSQGSGLWAVADGMGGHQAGEIASQLIVENLGEIPLTDDLATAFKAIEAALHATNRQLRNKAAAQDNRSSIGSTVVVLLICKEQAVCLWVGDSRIYRLRDNKLELLTHDHSHVQELVDHGLISAEEAEHHPMSNVVTRAIGVADNLTIDKITFPVHADDIYLLCSDGLTKVVGQDSYRALLQTAQPAQALVQQALQNEADDNVTAVVVKATSQPSVADQSKAATGFFGRLKRWFGRTHGD